jgi:hypothetical protein
MITNATIIIKTNEWSYTAIVKNNSTWWTTFIFDEDDWWPQTAYDRSWIFSSEYVRIYVP